MQVGPAFAAAAVGGTIRLLAASYRTTVVAGGEHWDRLRTERRPWVLAHWHDQLPFFTGYLRRELVARGHPLTVLISPSRDGEIGTRVGRAFGARVERGSASRGGTAGLRAVYRALTRDQSAVLIVPDGPRGPAHRVKPGTIVLAQLAQVPILPLASAASHSFHLGSWDRMVVPRPFTRVRVAVGEPQEVPRGLDEAAIEAHALRLGEALDALAGRAARAG